MVTDPFFSVVIPTHNRSALLAQAIQSVLSQTFTDFELIVVDDHSTDETQKQLAHYDDPRLTYFLNDHSRGGAGARNAGIARAQGHWIAFLDDDDVWLPQKLAQQYQKIMSVSAEVGLIYTGYATYDFQRNQILAKVYPEKEGWILQDLLYKNWITGFCGVAVRTDLLKKVGGLDEQLPALQDIDLYVRVAEHAAIAYVNAILVYLRKGHTDRISTNWDAKLAGFELFIDKFAALLAQNPAARQQMNSRLFVYALLARRFNKLSRFGRAQLFKMALDYRNYAWFMRELGAYWLNYWRLHYGQWRARNAPMGG